MAKRVVFLMSDTGGGHRASANALVEAFDHLHGPAVRCEVVDVFAEYAHWPLNRLPRLYRPLVDRYGWLWRLFWHAGERSRIWRVAVATVRRWHAGSFEQLFADYPADLFVSVHPLLNHAPLWEVRRRMPGTPFATVVTDLATAHPVWYAPDVDMLCSSCGEVRRAALAAGVPPERIQLTGLPIRLSFASQPPSRGDVRRQLGLADKPAVLILGGGEGMGPVEAIAREVSAGLAAVDGQAIVICGRNAALRKRLDQIAWPVPVRVLGFVEAMPAWMNAADCLVTKAGPGTIAEALACGLPMVVSSFIYGQEKGNVDFVLDHGVGYYAPDPAEIATTVAQWLQPGHPAIPQMKAKARALARPRAALEIASVLSEHFLG